MPRKHRSAHSADQASPSPRSLPALLEPAGPETAPRVLALLLAVLGITSKHEEKPRSAAWLRLLFLGCPDERLTNFPRSCLLAAREDLLGLGVRGVGRLLHAILVAQCARANGGAFQDHDGEFGSRSELVRSHAQTSNHRFESGVPMVDRIGEGIGRATQIGCIACFRDSDSVNSARTLWSLCSVNGQTQEPHPFNESEIDPFRVLNFCFE